MDTQHPHLSLTKLLNNTAQFIFHHFLALLVAIGVPLFVSYGLVWVTAGAVVNELKTAQSFEQAAAIFNFTSPTAYTLLIVALIVLGINILGWVAGPLVTIREGKITYKEILNGSLKYFWTFFALSLMVIGAAVIILVASFLLILIVITIVGFIDQNSIGTWEGLLIAFVPDVLLIVMTISFLFAPYFVIDKQLGAWPAILASVSLVRHHFLNVVVRFLLLCVMIIVIAFVVELIPIFGGTLAYIFSLMTITVYNYYIYKALTNPVTTL